MPRKIFDISIEEITLCKSPSNRKKFFIKKMEKTMEEFIEELRRFMSDIEVDEEGEENEEAIKKAMDEALTDENVKKAEKLPEKAMNAIKGALNLLNKFKGDMSEEILKAMQTLAKYASYGYPEAKQEDVKKEREDLEKAGAKLSKTTRDQIAKVLALIKESPKAIAMLKTLLGQEVEKVETKGDEENLSEDTLAKLEKAEEIIKTEKERVEKEAKDLTDKKEKEIEDLKKDVEDLKKTPPVKKSIDGDGGGEGEEEEIDLWPSVPVIVRGEV